MVSNKNKITIDFDRVFLRSKNDELPTSFLDKKTLKQLRKVPFIQRNKLIQDLIVKRNKLKIKSRSTKLRKQGVLND